MNIPNYCTVNCIVNRFNHLFSLSFVKCELLHIFTNFFLQKVVYCNLVMSRLSSSPSIMLRRAGWRDVALLRDPGTLLYPNTWGSFCCRQKTPTSSPGLNTSSHSPPSSPCVPWSHKYWHISKMVVGYFWQGSLHFNNVNIQVITNCPNKKQINIPVQNTVFRFFILLKTVAWQFWTNPLYLIQWPNTLTGIGHLCYPSIVIPYEQTQRSQHDSRIVFVQNVWTLWSIATLINKNDRRDYPEEMLIGRLVQPHLINGLVCCLSCEPFHTLSHKCCNQFHEIKNKAHSVLLQFNFFSPKSNFLFWDIWVTNHDHAYIPLGMYQYWHLSNLIGRYQITNNVGQTGF